MLAKKTIFIIPGFGEFPSDKSYKTLSKTLKSLGFYPISVKLSWEGRGIADNAEYFLKQYKKIVRKKKYMLGFSFGAMVAMIAATKTRTSGLVLCSLSPYFQEDMGMSDLKSSSLTQKLKTRQVRMLYGTKEDRKLVKRSRDTFRKIRQTNKRLVSIKNAPHNIGNKKYLHRISQIAQTLH